MKILLCFENFEFKQIVDRHLTDDEEQEVIDGNLTAIRFRGNTFELATVTVGNTIAWKEVEELEEEE